MAIKIDQVEDILFSSMRFGYICGVKSMSFKETREEFKKLMIEANEAKSKKTGDDRNENI